MRSNIHNWYCNKSDFNLDHILFKILFWLKHQFVYPLFIDLSNRLILQSTKWSERWRCSINKLSENCKLILLWVGPSCQSNWIKDVLLLSQVLNARMFGQVSIIRMIFCTLFVSSFVCHTYEDDECNRCTCTVKAL